MSEALVALPLKNIAIILIAHFSYPNVAFFFLAHFSYSYLAYFFLSTFQLFISGI